MNEQLRLPEVSRPVVIGIGGCSGSGKTTLARELATDLEATLLPLDLYYRDLSHLPLAQRHHQNFDHPDSLESELLVKQVFALRSGQAVEPPVYDFSQHARVHGAYVRMQPSAFLIVEGILALHFADLLPMYDLRVYVDTSHPVCLDRRIERDVRERGRTRESVIEQFEATARPMADVYVLPSQAQADVVVQGTEALDWSVESVLAALRQRGLLERHGSRV